jgi:hypothetical protein
MNEFIGCLHPNLINQVRTHLQPASAGLSFCEASVLTDADIRSFVKIRVHSWFYSAPPGQDAILTYSGVNLVHFKINTYE